MRPASAALLGHAVSHPQALLKGGLKSHAAHVQAMTTQVADHIACRDGLRTVEQISWPPPSALLPPPRRTRRRCCRLS